MQIKMTKGERQVYATRLVKGRREPTCLGRVVRKAPLARGIPMWTLNFAVVEERPVETRLKSRWQLARRADRAMGKRNLVCLWIRA